jgi:ribosomal protein S13
MILRHRRSQIGIYGQWLASSTLYSQFRRAAGLPNRGQRTRSNGRTARRRLQQISRLGA